jgi:excisionase family DNA binding protein
MAAIEYLDPSTRLEKAWARVRDLRALRFKIEQELIEAEAHLDAERGRETPDRISNLLTIPDAANRLDVSESMLWKAIRAGRLSTTKIGRSTRVSEAELRAFVERGR